MAKNPYPSEVQDRFIVRLPDGMRDAIAAAAKANGRSMNAEIVSRLESKGQDSSPLIEAIARLNLDLAMTEMDAHSKADQISSLNAELRAVKQLLATLLPEDVIEQRLLDAYWKDPPDDSVEDALWIDKMNSSLAKARDALSQVELIKSRKNMPK
ncbi:Arc family DNA-binding protein [Massilia scottii]|uniref:Arc family DNA-binding protein n=1 Tax=Massilia scottii TaxID=3057166 RepID=UPI002796C579|nr:Arc family DNA-binding protein [Massilia sp. CCM 9029]MDQ1831951.1 Arc family DNA-binding protein [Massilia sp. CCM 9029]